MKITIKPAKHLPEDASISADGEDLIARAVRRAQAAGFEVKDSGGTLRLSAEVPFFSFESLNVAMKSGPIGALWAVYRPHPIGAFLPKNGTQDLSLTLDSNRWRELDEARTLYKLESLIHSDDHGANWQVDSASSFELRGEADLKLARRMEETFVFPEEAPWQKL